MGVITFKSNAARQNRDGADPPPGRVGLPTECHLCIFCGDDLLGYSGYSAGTTFWDILRRRPFGIVCGDGLIFCGDDPLDERFTLGVAGKTFCVTDLNVMFPFSQGRPSGPKPHLWRYSASSQASRLKCQMMSFYQFPLRNLILHCIYPREAKLGIVERHARLSQKTMLRARGSPLGTSPHTMQIHDADHLNSDFGHCILSHPLAGADYLQNPQVPSLQNISILCCKFPILCESSVAPDKILLDIFCQCIFLQEGPQCTEEDHRKAPQPFRALKPAMSGGRSSDSAFHRFAQGFIATPKNIHGQVAPCWQQRHPIRRHLVPQ